MTPSRLQPSEHGFAQEVHYITRDMTLHDATRLQPGEHGLAQEVHYEGSIPFWYKSSFGITKNRFVLL